jgi:hypothetical protein
VIFLAGLLVGIVLTSIASFALLGLCLSSRERDEREQLGYRELYVDSMPPDIESWVNRRGDAA